jgi:hypothetical protein
MQLVHERSVDLMDANERVYDRAFIYAEPQGEGTWRAWIDFVSQDGEQTLRTDRETTQSNLEAVAYWATGLEAIYFEGAFRRALRKDVALVPTASGIPSAAVVRLRVESLDPEVPLRMMATRTLVPGLRRRIPNGGVLVYEGAAPGTRGGLPTTYDFLAQFASANAAGRMANTLWNDLHGAGAVLQIEDLEVPIYNAAIKEALLLGVPV